jgi:hypothetical protein
MSGVIRNRTPKTLAAIAFTALVTVVTTPAPAIADAGVGIDPGEITGLPPVEVDTATSVVVTVRNPGTDAAAYQMLAQPLGGEPELPIDPAWFSFEPASFDIGGGAAQEVLVTFTVPKGSGAGDYLALVTAQLVLGEPDTAGAQVGAAVAAKLFFTVPKGSDPPSSGVPIGLVIGAIVAAVVVASVLVWRKLGIRLSVSRGR